MQRPLNHHHHHPQPPAADDEGDKKPPARCYLETNSSIKIRNPPALPPPRAAAPSSFIPAATTEATTPTPTTSSKEGLQCRLNELKGQEQCGPYMIHFQHHATVSLEFYHCRREFTRQCYDMVDEFRLDPEIVEVTIWMMDMLAMELDTSLLRADTPQTRRRYRSKGMIAFVIAAKAAASDGGQQSLSRLLQQTARFPTYWKKHFSSEEDMEQAELDLLLQFNFAVRPPTVQGFAQTLLRLLPPAMLQIATDDHDDTAACGGTTNTTQNPTAKTSSRIFEQVMDLVNVQTRLSLTSDPLFVVYSHLPSRMAQAALQNAIQHSRIPRNRHVYMQYCFAKALAAADGRGEEQQGHFGLPQQNNPDALLLQSQLSNALVQHLTTEREKKLVELQQGENYKNNQHYLEKEKQGPPSIPSVVFLPDGIKKEPQVSLLSVES